MLSRRHMRIPGSVGPSPASVESFLNIPLCPNIKSALGAAEIAFSRLAFHSSKSSAVSACGFSSYRWHQITREVHMVFYIKLVKLTANEANEGVEYAFLIFIMKSAVYDTSANCVVKK